MVDVFTYGLFSWHSSIDAEDPGFCFVFNSSRFLMSSEQISFSFFSSFLLVFFHINFDVQLSSLRWKHFKIFLPFLASPRSHWFQFLQSNFLLVSCLRCVHFCLIMSASPGDEHVSLYRNRGRCYADCTHLLVQSLIH